MKKKKKVYECVKFLKEKIYHSLQNCIKKSKQNLMEYLMFFVVNVDANMSSIILEILYMLLTLD